MVEPMKDPEAAHPVASAWRPILAAVVRAFVRDDFQLAAGVPTVAAPTRALAARLRAGVAAYGETLAELTDETWETSVAQWYGRRWEVLVDLRTVEAGRSDLVLHVDVEEADGGHRFKIHLIYVP